ncbi:MlaE family lipid ABC transporter permease subunit [Helicobacter canis]|uniref:MlaE family lipid ABC transporter permease subunit n=1 Tax=Helicobacter canis TaxID=29419 RepID=UPI002943C63E|nr:MlaE family lipid ABC transporter permease subunit [Helicobacter canis]
MAISHKGTQEVQTPYFRIDSTTAQAAITIGGVWDFRVPKHTLFALRSALESRHFSRIIFEQDAIIDLAFGIFLKTHLHKSLEIQASEHIQAVLDQCLVSTIPPTPKRHLFRALLTSLGKWVYSFYQSFLDFLNFVGMSFYYLALSLWRRDVRLTPLLYHINESGFKALPVSLLTAFIVGFAIALQGAVQLELMGAPMLSIEMTAKLSLREMGPFILALVIAGRSASSFTAQIGVMRLTDEIDAMKTMNFHPITFLVIPRLFALIIVMPLLVFLADAFSLLGGMLAVYVQLGIDMGTYIDRVYESVSWSHFFIGLIKAPFFGAAIALVGCFRGFCIKENTQELGRITTISVVNALFWIIAINAVFSFITSRLGI